MAATDPLRDAEWALECFRRELSVARQLKYKARSDMEVGTRRENNALSGIEACEAKIKGLKKQ